jgi:transcriptional regulator with XRE-family HTH domain
MTADPSEPPDPGVAERAERLKQAMNFGGGGAAIARRIGMPIATLNNYLAGRDMKASALVALAEAAGVSIEWLGTGRGAMIPGQTVVKDNDIGILKPAVLESPAHFWGLLVMIRSCQEFHQQMKLTPTLAEVLAWISTPYLQARNLPDARIEFKSPEELLP